MYEVQISKSKSKYRVVGRKYTSEQAARKAFRQTFAGAGVKGRLTIAGEVVKKFA